MCLGCLGVETHVFILVSGVHSQAVRALLGNIQEAPGGSLLADVLEARAGHRVPGTHPQAAVDVGRRGGGWVLGKIYIFGESFEKNIDKKIMLQQHQELFFLPILTKGRVQKKKVKT